MYLPETDIENVYWIILVMFFGLTILSWWAVRKDWLKEETENHQEQIEEPLVQTENIEQQ